MPSKRPTPPASNTPSAGANRSQSDLSAPQSKRRAGIALAVAAVLGVAALGVLQFMPTPAPQAPVVPTVGVGEPLTPPSMPGTSPTVIEVLSDPALEPAPLPPSPTVVDVTESVTEPLGPTAPAAQPAQAPAAQPAQAPAAPIAADPLSDSATTTDLKAAALAQATLQLAQATSLRRETIVRLTMAVLLISETPTPDQAAQLLPLAQQAGLPQVEEALQALARPIAPTPQPTVAEQPRWQRFLNKFVEITPVDDSAAFAAPTTTRAQHWKTVRRRLSEVILTPVREVTPPGASTFAPSPTPNESR